MWQSLQICLASNCLRRGPRPAVSGSCNAVRHAFRSGEKARSVAGAHTFERRRDYNLIARCFAHGPPAHWHVHPSIEFGSIAMTRSAGSQAMACFSEQSAEGREQLANSTAGGRDKRGSPVEPQAIGMAWVLACRSVGARAAPCIFTNAIKGVYGTLRAFNCSEALP
jgi:hypothetical protein